MADLVTTATNLVTLTFVVTSMLMVGLGLTLLEMTRPLRNAALVIMALVGNFAVIPAIALVILRVMPLESDDKIGLVLLAVAAGAPFLPKLAQIARADVPFAASLMALLILVTVVYLPVALPLLLPGIRIDGASIALALLLTILVPLGLGLFVRWQWPKIAQKLLPALTVVSNISLVLLLVLMLGLNVGNVLDMFGSGAILAMVMLTAAAGAAGYLLGGPQRETRYVMAFGTGQRNIAATFIIANGNFADRPQVLVFLAAASVISMLLVLPVAAMLGKRGTRQPVVGRGAAQTRRAAYRRH
jgi:predicted Na+-dependent transporter